MQHSTGALEELTLNAPKLQEILSKTPHLGQTVKRSVWKEFSHAPDEPFPSDLDFINLINAIFEVRGAYTTLEDHIKHTHSNLTAKHQNRIEELGIPVLAALEEAEAYGKDLVQRRVQAHATAKAAGKSCPLEPRLVRLARRLQLPDRELYAMAYIAISYSELLSCNPGKGFSFSDMCRMCNLTITEGLHFISPSRQHVTEGIFSPDEDDPMRYPCKIPFTTCLALAGVELSENEMLKIDKTMLHEILMEEQDGPEKYALRRSSSSMRAKKTIDDSSLDDEEKVDDGNMAGVADDDKDDESNIYDFLRAEVMAETRSSKKETTAESDSSALSPYTSNTSYLADHVDWVGTRIRLRNITREREGDLDKDPRKDLQLRELSAKERMFKAKIDKRMALTLEASSWVPRLERLATRLQLETFEKNVLVTLTCNVVSCHVSPDSTTYGSYGSPAQFQVRNLLQVFCDGFEDEIQCRKYFYKSAKLVKEGIIRLSESWTSELMTNMVEIDRRMLDFIVGLDTELSELVEGSHLYTPVVDLSQVILPDDQKQLITRTVGNFDSFAKSRKRLGFDQVMSYGSGILMLFFGKSGTGKTMMANAVAKMLGKRILLINYPSLGQSVADAVIRFIFREAKLNDAVLFFDECESIFQSRDNNAGGVNLLLTEIERHNGLIIMATNRAYDLDEAMHRRITLAIEFKNPDPFLRSAIWKAHIPPSVSLSSDVNFDELAVKYELTGGLIKNALVYALSEAVSRNAEKPVIEQKDLQQGALYQLRGHLSMVDFERRVVPTRTLDDLIVDTKIQKQLQHIIQMEKARQVLYSEWGFSEKMLNDQGTTCLFHGPPGTGKTVAAEAIGFETGRPLKVINCAELVSQYVGQTGKNIEAMFKEAKAMDAILVFDDAEALFGKRNEQSNSTDRYANMDTGLLLYHMERFPGICVVTTNLINNIDQAFFRRFRFIVEFTLPSSSLIEKLWRIHLPPKAPLAKDVNFRTLAERYPFTGGVIKNCCFKAASAVALRVDPAKRIISMADLVEAASYADSTTSSNSFPSQMFN